MRCRCAGSWYDRERGGKVRVDVIGAQGIEVAKKV